ncbi:MAG TPA: MBL fold metallo-hydrolase [Candidatus Limnocylindria bacterium]|nr:MBL fold metallo-hydrolase [Candidatus Limnocylindria bacterium]
MQLATSLHRIGSDQVNAYLVEGADGLTLIDAGLPGHWSELEAELRRLGRSMDDVRGVVLTHGDTDHIGFAERLRRERGVPVYVHEDDAARARGEVKKPNSGWGPVSWRALLRFLWYSGRRGGMRVPPLRQVETVADGATLDLPGAPQIIHLPGHTPGSVAVWVPTVEALFVGDALTTDNVLSGRPGLGPSPFTLDLPRALASLSRLQELPARWLLPGHGTPWQGSVADAVAQVRAAAAAS